MDGSREDLKRQIALIKEKYKAKKKAHKDKALSKVLEIQQQLKELEEQTEREKRTLPKGKRMPVEIKPTSHQTEEISNQTSGTSRHEKDQASERTSSRNSPQNATGEKTSRQDQASERKEHSTSSQNSPQNATEGKTSRHDKTSERKEHSTPSQNSPRNATGGKGIGKNIKEYADEIDMEITPSSRPQSDDEMEVPAPNPPTLPPSNLNFFDNINFLDLSTYVDSLDNDAMQQIAAEIGQTEVNAYGLEDAEVGGQTANGNYGQVETEVGGQTASGNYGQIEAKVGETTANEIKDQIEAKIGETTTNSAQEQNPSTLTDPDIREERVAQKVFEYIKADGQIPELKKKPKTIRNDHLLAKMEEILVEVKKLRV